MRVIGYSNTTDVNGYASSAALVRDIAFNESLDNINYIVLPVLKTIVPAGSISITNKTTSGFRIRVDAPGGTFSSGSKVIISWIAFEIK